MPSSAEHISSRARLDLRRDLVLESLLVLVLAILAGAYLTTPAGVNSIDTLFYLQHAEAPGGWTVFHSHHLVFPQAIKAWFRLWQWLGWAGRAEVPLRVLSALGSLGAAVVFFRLAALILPWRRHAAGATLLFGLSYLPWHFSSQGEPVPWFLFFACWILLLQTRVLIAGFAPRGLLVTLAAVSWAGICLHQELVLTLPLSLVAVWRGRSPGWAFLVAGSTGILAAAAYAAGAWIGTGGGQEVSLVHWLTRYLHEFGHTYGRLDLILSSAPFSGAAGAFIGGEALKKHVFGGAELGIAALGTLGFCLWLGTILILGWGLALRSKPSLRPCPRPVSWLLVTSAVIFAAAAIWWEPANRKFWAPVLPCLWLLASCGWTRVGKQTGIMIWAITLCGLVAANLAGGIIGKHQRQDARQPLLLFLENAAGPQATIVLAENRVWQCAQYYLGWEGILGLPGPKSDRWPDRQVILTNAVAKGKSALEKGLPVFCGADLPLPFMESLAAAFGPEGPSISTKPILVHCDPESPDLVQVLQEIRLTAGPGDPGDPDATPGQDPDAEDRDQAGKAP